MIAPTVTRPAHPDMNAAPASAIPAAVAAQYAKWIVLGVVLAGVIAIIVVSAVSIVQNSRVEKLKQQWDIVFTAAQNKTKPEEKVTALEAAVNDAKLQGSPAHAYALLQIADYYFDKAIQPETRPEERAAHLKKAAETYKVLAENEPFRSNPAFGPVALGSLASCYEQGGEYDAGIKLLSEGLGAPEMESHLLYNNLRVQLGRMYYLRSIKEGNPNAKADSEAARKTLTDALQGMIGKEREGGSDADRSQQAAYFADVEYLISLLDKPGKALPGGIAPPVKTPPAAEKAPEAKAGAGKPAETVKPAEAAKPAEPAKSAEPAKKDEKAAVPAAK